MDNKLVFFHVLVVLLVGLILPLLSGILKFVFVPYLAYLLLRTRAEHLPALMILLGYGSILTIVAGLLCIPLISTSLKRINNPHATRLYYALVAMFPVYAFLTLLRVFAGVGFVDALVMNAYYIAFWFLLYGWLLCDQFSDKNTYDLVRFGFLLTFFIPILNASDAFGGLSRSASIFLAVGVVLMYNNLLLTKVKHVYVLILLIFMVALYLPNLKFTFYLSILIAILAYTNRQTGEVSTMDPVTKNKGVGRLIFVFPILFLFLTVWLTPYVGLEFKGVAVDYSLNNLLGQIGSKLFVDRGIIWIGVVKGIANNTNFFPPVVNWDISYVDLTGSRHDVGFESHSLLLELIRGHGYLFGTLLIYFFLQAMVRLYHAVPYLRGLTAIVAVAVFGQGISVFVTGQYVLMLNLSFLFMLLTGGLIGYAQAVKARLQLRQSP